LACRVEAAVPDYLSGAPTRLRQILINLVGNAVKFTNQGEVVLTVRLDSVETGRALLHFAIRDTGIGIPADKQSAVFNAFEQADVSTTRRFGGTGLGLAISEHLVQLMGGEICVHSEAGRGSTFYFTARFEVCDEHIVEHSVPAQISGTRALIVDDNATNRQILTEMLAGFQLVPIDVATATDAIGALKQAHLEGQPFDLVVSDVHMPEMDGFMLVEWIRGEPDFANTRVILLTSGGSSGDNERCRQLDVNGYSIKPVKQSTLYDLIVGSLVSPIPMHNDFTPVATDHGLPPYRLLLAEDNEVNRMVACTLLTQWGQHVETASDGNEAVRRVESEQFDFVLMDVHMPTMGGLEATETIRVRERETGGARLPIIAMTADAMKGDRERCLAAGMDGYVTKPINREALRQAILELEINNPSTPSSHCGFDWGTFIRRMGNEELATRMVKAFLYEDEPRLESELQDAIDRSDGSGIHHAAHALRGALGELGAADAVESAWQLESMGKESELQDIQQTYDAFVIQIRSLTEELAKRVTKQ